MWTWLKIRRKKIILIAASMTTVVILALAVWVLQLNSRISESLKNKKFLPPTEYFSAPEFLRARMNISRADFVAKLTERKYSPRTLNDRLRSGEFAEGNSDSCAQLVAGAFPTNGKTCVLLILRETEDPEIKNFGLQMLVFDGDDKPVQAFRGNPLVAVDFVALEPILVAQYLDKEPIQQNYTPLGEIPTMCLNAVLAIEDAKFLEHSGVSITGFGRALLRNLSGGRVTQGGSTITQQLVKNYFLTAERTLKRKVTELLMSLILEVHSSKDEIFETYLNIIYLGQNGPFQVRGFPAAAEHYFGKPIQSLELPECALMAAVLNSPGLYDPFSRPENSWKRRNLVIDKMLEHGFIRADEADLAKRTPLPQRNQVNVSETAPYYIDAVQKEMAALSIPTLGMHIYMGLDLPAQALAQKTVRDQLAALEQGNKTVKALKEKGKVLESVLVSADNVSGLVQAIVGGRGYRLTQFNRAIDGHRQVGSVMKPFVYLAALENGTGGKIYTPSTTLHDARFTYEYQHQTWSPENYGKKYFGDVPMYFALKSSLNCATASLGLEVGLGKIITAAQAAGVESRLQEVPSLTLGAFELSPKEVLQAYSTLANLGQKRKLRTLRAVTNEFGGVIYESASTVENALPPEATAQLVSMMEQTLISGTARSAFQQGFTIPAAGKTGTTSENKDSWFAGFTPYLTTIVWVGYDDNTSHGLTGASGALPIWTAYMKNQAMIFPGDEFSWPTQLIKAPVPLLNEDPNQKGEPPQLLFVKGTEPRG